MEVPLMIVDDDDVDDKTVGENRKSTPPPCVGSSWGTPVPSGSFSYLIARLLAFPQQTAGKDSFHLGMDPLWRLVVAGPSPTDRGIGPTFTGLLTRSWLYKVVVFTLGSYH